MAFVNVVALPRQSSSMAQQRPLVMSQTEPVSVDGAEKQEQAERSGPCAGCGRPEGVAAGCDGNGRIIGGLGAFLSWWPIKAYRPCPDYLNAKKVYRRAGQSLDEIAFGRKAEGDDKSISERLGGK